MPKPRSGATELRMLRKEFLAMSVQYQNARRDCEVYRVRATKAEQEAAEWKKRFDILLAKLNQPIPDSK